MLIENVQIDSRYQRVSQRVLLIEESRIGSFFTQMPHAPFIHKETDPAFGIILIHDLTMARDERVHVLCFPHRIIPFLFRES